MDHNNCLLLTGSETWRVFFERLDRRDRNDSDAWVDITPAEFPAKISNFARAIQTRHPLERILSSYRYVFESSDLRRTEDLNLRLLEKYEGYDRETDPDSIFPGKLVSFKNFVRFLVRGEEDFPGEDKLVNGGEIFEF